MARVEERAVLGKHNIPKETILRRYQNGLNLLPSYINHFDKVRLIDSTKLLLSDPIVFSKYKPFVMPESHPLEYIEFYIPYNENYPFDFNTPINVKKPIYYKRLYRRNKKIDANNYFMFRNTYENYIPQYFSNKEAPEGKRKVLGILNIAYALIFEEHFESFSEVQEEKYYIQPNTYFSTSPRIIKEKEQFYSTKINYDGYLDRLLRYLGKHRRITKMSSLR